MSDAILSHASRPGSPAVSGTTLAVSMALAVWFALVAVFGASGTFVTAPGAPPVPIAIGATVPVILFLVGLRMSRPFRDFILSIDPYLIAAIQAWRFAGFGFLALYTYGVLPGMFAWPAGIGDIAIAVTAPWILLALLRRPGFAASRTFVLWNALGVLDLVVAIGTGALASTLAGGAAGEVTTRPMTLLPLVLIPAFIVPLYVMLHAIALYQARRLASGQMLRA